MAAVRRTLKRWRTAFRPGRPMFWERPISFAGVRYAAGDPLPASLYSDKTWLRTRWIARLIDFVPASMAVYMGANRKAAARALAGGSAADPGSTVPSQATIAPVPVSPAQGGE